MNPDFIFRYFPHLSEQQKKQFIALFPLYSNWNSKINLISRKDIEQLYLHHVLHSLAIAKVVLFKDGSHVLDVGTGGGFPGIPLAIMFPHTQFTLVDSIEKKIKVVREICLSAEINNVVATHARVEELKGQWDFIVSRAVTRLRPFTQWVSGKVSKTPRHSIPNGILYLKGGNLEEELDEIDYPYHVYELRKIFQEPFFETKKLLQVSI